MGFVVVMFEEDIRWVMELGNDNVFSVVDDEGVIGCYEWNFVYINFLFFDFFYGIWCFVIYDY